VAKLPANGVQLPLPALSDGLLEPIIKDDSSDFGGALSSTEAFSPSMLIDPNSDDLFLDKPIAQGLTGLSARFASRGKYTIWCI